jgi:hypothetical protein
MKPFLLLVLVAVTWIPVPARAQAAFEASAKLTCFAPNGDAPKLAKVTLSTNALLAEALATSQDVAEAYYLSYQGGFFFAANRCTNGHALTLAEQLDCQHSSSSTDVACSFTFDPWTKGSASGRMLCRLHSGKNGATAGSCDGVLDPEGLAPCRIQVKLGRQHQIPASCPPMM